MSRAVTACGLFFLSAWVSTADAADPQPLEVAVRAVACGEISGINASTGICHVIDFVEKKQYLELKVAVGLRADAGIIVAGASGKAMLEVTMKLPANTSREAALRVAKTELSKQLRAPGTKRAIEGAGMRVSRIQEPREVLYCSERDPLEAKLRKALGR